MNYGKKIVFEKIEQTEKHYKDREITISNDDVRFISGRDPLINPFFSRIIATFGAPIFGYHNIYTFDPSFALCQFEKLA